MKRKIMYLCDMQKCKRCSVRDGINDGWDCRRTIELKHAKNYTTQPPTRVLEKKFEKSFYPDMDIVVYAEREEESNGKDS